MPVREQKYRYLYEHFDAAAKHAKHCGRLFLLVTS